MWFTEHPCPSSLVYMVQQLAGVTDFLASTFQIVKAMVLQSTIALYLCACVKI